MIDPDTGMPHKCDPAVKIVQEGKWKGFSYSEMARLWYNKKMADKDAARK